MRFKGLEGPLNSPSSQVANNMRKKRFLPNLSIKTILIRHLIMKGRLAGCITIITVQVRLASIAMNLKIAEIAEEAVSGKRVLEALQGRAKTRSEAQAIRGLSIRNGSLRQPT